MDPVFITLHDPWMYWLMHMLSHRLTQTAESGQAQELSVVDILLFQQLPPPHPPAYHLLSSSSLRGCILEWEDRVASAVGGPGCSSATYEEGLGQMTSSLCALFSPVYKIDMEQITPTS